MEASGLSRCLRSCCFIAGTAAAPGFGGRVFGCGWGGRLSGLRLGVFRGKLLQGSENNGGGALDNFKAFRQQYSVAVVKLDVVGGSGAGLESDGFAHDKGDGLGFGLPHNFGYRRAAVGLVQHFVS